MGKSCRLLLVCGRVSLISPLQKFEKLRNNRRMKILSNSRTRTRILTGVIIALLLVGTVVAAEHPFGTSGSTSPVSHATIGNEFSPLPISQPVTAVPSATTTTGGNLGSTDNPQQSAVLSTGSAAGTTSVPPIAPPATSAPAPVPAPTPVHPCNPCTTKSGHMMCPMMANGSAQPQYMCVPCSYATTNDVVICNPE